MTPALIWFLIGFALVLVEFALPGVIIVFLGLGAWVTALFVWLGWAESVGAQTAVFMISSVMLLFGLRHIFRGWFMGHSYGSASCTTSSTRRRLSMVSQR